MNYGQFFEMREEISLLAVMVLLLVFDIFANEKAKRFVQPLGLILLAAHTILNCIPREGYSLFGGMYQYVPMMTYIKTILSISTLIILLQANNWLKKDDNRIKQGDFFYLMLSTLLGMYFMISAGHFLLFFIGLETASIPMAALVAFDKYNNKSAEAGAKYILSAVFASAISLFGLSLLYGTTGTMYFNEVAAALQSGSPLQIMAFIFFAVGLFFKISLVPFHLWTADVYEGAPTNVTSYLSVVSKGAAVFVLFTIFVKVFATFMIEWQYILYGLIIVTITVANLFAIRQKNIKRFLAFSSISQAGYIMLAVISGTAMGMSTLVYYILVYMFSNLAVFGVVNVLEQRSGKVNISDYNGLYATNPLLSVIMMLALFSLGGIPPFAGFFSKFFIFMAAAEQGFYVLVFIALVNTIISLYYYLLVVKAMFINKNDSPIERVTSDVPAKISLVVCTLGIVLVGLISGIFDQITVLGFGI